MVLRKMCVSVLVLMLLCVSWSSVAAFGEKLPADEAIKVEMVLSSDGDTPTVMSGVLAVPTAQHPDPVKAFLNRYETTFAVSNLAENVREMTVVDDALTGDRHVRMQQLYKGIPIEGADFYVTVALNQAIAFSGKILPELQMNTIASVNPFDAKDTAINLVKGAITMVDDPELVIYEKEPKNFVLAYKTTVSGWDFAWVTYVDAQTGRVLNRFNNVQNYSTSMQTSFNGTQSIYVSSEGFKDIETISSTGYIRVMTANNGTSLPGTLVPLNATSTRLVKAAQMMYSLERAVNFYKTNFNRTSYDNNSASLTSTIEYSSNYANAYWTPTYRQFVFGDGGDLDGNGTKDCNYLGSVDIVGHEFSHAFCSSTSNLTYQNESGALNEANSDIMGAMIDPDQDWYMGEDIMIGTTTGLRNIINPQSSWGQALPRYYAERYTGTQDNGGVHINCSIGAKFFQLLADGGTWNNGTANVTVTGIGNAAALQIWYRSMTVKFTTSTTYAQARTYTIAAATDLYGATSNEVTQVGNAWTAVGVGGSTPPGDDPFEPNGTVASAYAITFGTNYDSYIYSSTDVDYYKFTVSGAGTVTITLANLPKDYDMFLYDTNGTTELARAYTSNNPETITKALTTAGTYYVKVNGYNSAFSTTSKYRISASFVPDDITGQWYYQTLSPTVSTPHNYTNNWTNTYTYKKTGATKVGVYFSKFIFETNYDFVYIYDKNNVQKAKYTGTKSAFWATVDGDTIIVKVTTDSSVVKYGYDISQTGYYSTGPLALNSLVWSGDIISLPSDVGIPGLKKTTGMLKNMPDPFNPETDIAFEVPVNGAVVLSVYNTRGKKIIELVNGHRDAGSHSVHWNGKDSHGKDMPSGIYYAVLEVNGERFTKKMVMLK